MRFARIVSTKPMFEPAKLEVLIVKLNERIIIKLEQREENKKALALL